MKNLYLTIEESELRTGFSKIQIWILIRNNIVRHRFKNEQTLVDINGLHLWMIRNCKTASELALPVDSRDSKFSLRRALRKAISRKMKFKACHG